MEIREKGDAAATGTTEKHNDTIKKEIKLQINRNVNELLEGSNELLNVCVHPKFMCWNPSTQSDGVRR